jgi:hypothetical protein
MKSWVTEVLLHYQQYFSYRYQRTPWLVVDIYSRNRFDGVMASVRVGKVWKVIDSICIQVKRKMINLVFVAPPHRTQ